MKDTFKITKTFINLIFVIVFILIFYKIFLIVRAVGNSKPLYEINVNSYNQVETYITEKYIINPDTKCLSFKDEIGIKRTVCNNYTITEY